MQQTNKTNETTVAWVSRHPPLPVQIEALKEKLGNIRMAHIHQTFVDYKQVMDTVNRTKARHAVVVLPLSIISLLLSTPEAKDIKWLRAEMEPATGKFDPDTDVLLQSPNGDRHLRFKEFAVLKEVRLVTEPL